jgi:tetratricopeptide (TPR) repeat protein
MSLNAGTRLGPYEIVAPLGAGGMGEVYRARDTRLGREVAVKVLPPGFAADPERLRRFEQEARSVAALNHPNILALHDVGTHEATPYLVTELLEGESLRDRLNAGAVPARTAVEIAIQVAQGLAAAHGKGIVHRDIKPANLFITGEGPVKILDFGIAKLAPPRDVGVLGQAATLVEATEPGMMLGTLGYMSPEQVRGAAVDQRSDIFSFGAVLFEMVTGRAAFARETGAETITAILKEELPEASSLVGGVPAALSRSIAHCLEKRAEDRFQSARDLVFDLKAIASSGGATAVGPASPPARRPRSAWLAAGLAAALAAVTGGFFILRGRPGKPAPVLEPKRVVVAVFENHTGDRELDPLGRMASDWIGQGLSQILSVEVVPTSVTIRAEQAALREMAAGSQVDPLLALAVQTGAGSVISGSYYVAGENLQLQAKVTDAARGKLIFAISPVTGPREAPMLLLETLRQRVMGVVAIHFGSQLGPQVRTPPLFEAYREHVAGLEVFGEDWNEAIRHFQRAAEIDPEFFSPQIWTASAYGLQGDFARADQILRRVNEHRERLTPFECDVLDWYRARLAGHYAVSLQAIERAHRLVPRSTLHAYLVAVAALKVNHPRQTANTFAGFSSDDVLELPPFSGTVWLNALADAHHMLGSYDRELAVADEAVRLFPEVLLVRTGSVRALAALGRLDELGGAIDRALSVQSRAGTPGELMVLAANELRAHGQREPAQRMTDRAVRWLRSRSPGEAATEAHRSALAGALYAAERWDEARVIYLELASLHPVAGGSGEPPEAQQRRGGMPESVRTALAIDYLGALGALAARRGDRVEAGRVSGELAGIERPFIFGAHTYRRACIAALLGDRQGAVDLLRESFAQGNPYDVTLHSDMDLEPLHGFPPFEELLRPKG